MHENLLFWYKNSKYFWRGGTPLPRPHPQWGGGHPLPTPLTPWRLSLKNAIACICGDVRRYTNFRICGIMSAYAILTRKLCYRKDDCTMRHIHGCPENFRDSLTTTTAAIPNSFHGLLFGSTLWMFLQNLKSVALSVPQIIGGTPKIWTVLDTPSLPFLQNFNRLLFRLTL